MGTTLAILGSLKNDILCKMMDPFGSELINNNINISKTITNVGAIFPRKVGFNTENCSLMTS